MYSDSDVEKLRLIREAMTGGRRVGELTYLSVAELNGLVEEDRLEKAVPAIGPQAEPSTQAAAAAFIAECVDAVRALDQDRLRDSFSRAVIALEPAVFLDRVATPLMHRIGALWHEGRLSPSHEHFATSVVRSVLGNVMAALQPANAAPGLVVATPTNQRHEIGAVLVAATAQLEGWHVTYLGGDLPSADIAKAVDETGARAVALSLTHPSADPVIEQELRTLRGVIAGDVEILVGGQAAASYRSVIEAVGALGVTDLAGVRTTLRNLAEATSSAG